MKKIVAILMAMLMVMSVTVAFAGGAAEGVNSDATIDGGLHKQISVQIVPEQLPVVEINKDRILLKSRQFIPIEGIGSILIEKIKTKAPKKSYVILQLEHIPTNEEKKELEEEGITLLSYIPNKAWFASVPSEKPEEIAAFPNVRAIDEILPEDKISSAVKNKNYVKNEDGTLNLSVMFFNDVNLDDAASLIENYGEVVDKFYAVNTVKIITKEKFISDIANEENVQWVDVIEKILEMHNNGNRENIGVNTLQASPYSLSGINVVTAEWDGGWVDTTHDDLQGRVTIGDTGSSTGDHATHVAGTMLGNGTLSESAGGAALQWRGMAPKATVISYEWWDDSTELNNEYNAAINTYDASLSQNSWGYEYTGCGGDCSGGYDSFAAELDEIVRGSKVKRISQIWSAGNKRPNDCDNGNYDCIGLPGTAKNVITVGATNSNDDSMTSFSSWGPTNDGRLKPEVVAPGCQVGGDGGVTSTIPVDTYDTYCGTSMSAPTTSGVVALMLEEFANNGIYPLPSTIKAILIHTAKDLGNAGPDYSYGYGRINATSAVDKIKADTGTIEVIKEESISDGETKEFNMTVSSTIKVTLVWDDYPAAANANPALVNDLDLVLIAPDSSLHYPWVLDPTTPANPATTGTNTIDNVEQVFVATPESGIWTVRVTGSSIPNGPQNFSLVSDHSFTIQPTVTVKTFMDSYTTEDKFFDLNEIVYIQANVTVGGEPITGATVTVDLILSDETVEDSLTLNEIGNGIYRNSWNSSNHNVDAYLVNVSVSNEVTGTGQTYFHLYSGSGVSAYQLDWNEDGNKDYVLENKHLIAVYDGKEYTDQSLLYLYQKDTNVSYTFGGISDPDSIGRGEITTSNMKDITFYSFSFSQEGENLTFVDLNLKTNVTDPPSHNSVYDLKNTSYPVWYGGVTTYPITSTNVIPGTTGTLLPLGYYTYLDTPDGSTLGIYGTNIYPYKYVRFEVLEPVETIDELFIGWWGYGEKEGIITSTYAAEAYVYNHTLGDWISIGTHTSSAITEISANFTSGVGDLVDTNGYIYILAVNPTRQAGRDSYIQTDYIMAETTWIPGITTSFNLTIQMKSEDVDYLAYKLHNFDQNISDINDIFSPITGTLGSSVSDDYYHLEDGSDDLVTSLTANQWNNYTNSNYTMVYDNSTSADSTDNNVVALVRFNESTGMKFDNSGLWYDNSYNKEGLRMRYNTSLATTSDKINYLLAFTKGDGQTIDQWMPNIAQRQFPTPNFMTPPAAGAPNVSVSVNTTCFGSVLAGNSTEIHVSLTLNNTGDASAEIEAVFKTNVSDVYGLNGTGESIIPIIPGNNFELGPDGNETALTNTTTKTLISTLPAGETVTYDAILIVPAGQAADDYNGIVELSW